MFTFSSVTSVSVGVINIDQFTRHQGTLDHHQHHSGQHSTSWLDKHYYEMDTQAQSDPLRMKNMKTNTDNPYSEIIVDQYNSLDNPYQESDYNKTILETDTEWLPKKGETYQSYVARATIYAKLASKHNIQSHINGPKGAWWTHRNPSGCFMCEDTNLISCLINILQIISKKYPKGTF